MSTDADAAAKLVPCLFPPGTAAIFPNHRRHTLGSDTNGSQAGGHHVAQAGPLADVIDHVGAGQPQAALAFSMTVYAWQLYGSH
jgi:hypothetical protein